ncbi:serine/threonine-protein kinase TNNI3K-like [Orbicella faveolata]|uniref:serine/threonine-protein kinase TNNI3K-like n=1 Tax=Orbicella faveolata TaxID=48498 RepID=UPI0009E4B272|nr:serine/threonine-protein kinase TNNI3K-like [Orbicella faveolata]
MEMLLKHGADTNLSDSFALTPLHLAAEKGNLRAVKKLVENPYSPADRNKRNRSDEIPAQVAESKQQENVLKYLLNDDAYEVDVSSDGDVVNVSSSTGSSVTVNSPGGTVHIMVGDSSTMNVNK